MRSRGIVFLAVLNLLAARSIQFKCGQPYYHSPKYPREGDLYPNQFPWFGVVYHRKSNSTIEYACGGTLISEKHVLTAKICASNKEGYLLENGDVIVRMGIYTKPECTENYDWWGILEQWNETQDKISLRTDYVALVLQSDVDIGDAQYRHVSKIHQPVDYDENSKNEIVILELYKTVHFNIDVIPICLQRSSHLVRPDTVLGWNADKGSIKHMEEFKRKTKRCSNNEFKSYYNLTEICLKDRGSIGISKYNDWYIEGIIDCTSPPIVPCKKEPNFKTIALIQIYSYKQWIIQVANLTSSIETRVEHFIEKKKRYQKSKTPCGKKTVNHPEDDIKEHEIDPYLGQWPWYGTVYHRIPNRTMEYACGGTLISDKHVITATICASNENRTLLDSRNILVQFGTHIQNFFNFGFAQYRHVSKIHQPVEYDKNSANKIVIFELKMIVKFNDYVQPICLCTGYTYDSLNGIIGRNAAGEKGHLAQFKTYVKQCPESYDSEFYNFTDICNKDRGGIGLIQHFNGWYLDIIIDCTIYIIPLETTSVSYYIPWISLITNLDYLRIIRDGQDFDTSKQYPRLLPRLNCGHTLANDNENDPTDRQYQNPWIARIIIPNVSGNKADYLYVGTLISHRYVLTLAIQFRTVYPHAERNMYVRLGMKLNQDQNKIFENKIDSVLSARDFDVEYVVLHQNAMSIKLFPNYYPNDIALIRTKKDVLFEDHIHPICLPLTQKLQRVEMVKHNNTDCFLYSSASKICYMSYRLDLDDAAMFCRSSKECSTKGLPLGKFVRSRNEQFVQFGILYREGDLMLYTNVSYHMDWIIANMEP